jgi:hypothetical protein
VARKTSVVLIKHHVAMTWPGINFRTENLTEVLNGFLPLTQVPLMIQIKTQVLNLKTLKTQVPMGYLTFFFFFLIFFCFFLQTTNLAFSDSLSFFSFSLFWTGN